MPRSYLSLISPNRERLQLSDNCVSVPINSTSLKAIEKDLKRGRHGTPTFTFKSQSA